MSYFGGSGFIGVLFGVYMGVGVGIGVSGYVGNFVVGIEGLFGIDIRLVMLRV